MEIHLLLSPSESTPNSCNLSSPANRPSTTNMSSPMAEAPAQTPAPRDAKSADLSESESRSVSELLAKLRENSYAYADHVTLIHLLHKGLMAHVGPTGDSSTTREPRDYRLLTDLRQAREAMDTRFAVGEAIWIDWLTDEILVAACSEERISVTELCQRAVQDEPASVRLWQIYADWVEANHAACSDRDGADHRRWTDEDKDVCRELFTRDMLQNVLEQAVEATRWRIDQSHVLWDRHAAMVVESMPTTPSRSEIDELNHLFVQRLHVPHAARDNTAQRYWPLVSRYEGERWNDVMDGVNAATEEAMQLMRARRERETDLAAALQVGDDTATFAEFERYLHWETKRRHRQDDRPELRCGLFERALLRFPAHADWWLDYIDYATGTGHLPSVLPLVERATRHCPWSGELWARRLLQSDVEGLSHEDMEATKHRATNSGLLEMGGLEALVLVLEQWCSYLHRYAFRRADAEDEMDTAEFGISAAIQDIADAGRRVAGPDFAGDSHMRLESIHIKFLSESRRFADARDVFRQLVPRRRRSYQFWTHYYTWEIWLWGHQRAHGRGRVDTADNGLHLATQVVREALRQRDLDWPEKVLEMYRHHFQMHESADQLRSALIDAREFAKALALRRAREAEAEGTQVPPAAVTVDAAAAGLGDKRKREGDALQNGHGEKKARRDEAEDASASVSVSGSVAAKRDREHTTVTVRNLPRDVQERDLRHFFRDVGDPLSIALLADASGDTCSATVEFARPDDVLAARTRDGKEVCGRAVRIASGTQSTLYVANYPADYDEAAMRKLFASYGEIVGVRFPSLTFNNRRRFCYVQFLTAASARAAEAALDDKMLDGRHRLLAKISDPERKKDRAGAQAEGRELFVRNLDRAADDDEIRAFFRPHGDVVALHAVKLASGKRTGTAFVAFADAAAADAAALATHGTPFRDRILQVEKSSPRGRAAPPQRARKEDVLVPQSSWLDGPTPNAAAIAAVAVDLAAARVHACKEDGPLPRSSWSDGLKPAGDNATAPLAGTARARQAAVLHLPDTVHDARVRRAMEAVGPLVKVQIRRRDGGAIVEFRDPRHAFRARQGGVDCAELGADVRTGGVEELLGGETRGFEREMRSTMLSDLGIVRRDKRGGLGVGSRGGRGWGRGGSEVGSRGGVGWSAGRRGGLGVGSRGGGGWSPGSTSTTTTRSNDDFRRLLERSRGGEEEKAEEA